MRKKEVKKSREPAYSVEKQLLENLVHLQKVHTNLAEKFEKLSKQIGDLLVLFEVAARSFAKQPSIQLGTISDKDKEFLEKIDKLLEQNKVIAKGLTLMEERIRERVFGGMGSPSPSGIMESQEEMMEATSIRPMNLPYPSPQVIAQSMQPMPMPQMQQLPSSQQAQQAQQVSPQHREEKEESEEPQGPSPSPRPLPKF